MREEKFRMTIWKKGKLFEEVDCQIKTKADRRFFDVAGKQFDGKENIDLFFMKSFLLWLVIKEELVRFDPRYRKDVENKAGMHWKHI